MKNNTKLAITFVAVVALTATVFALRSNTTNLSSQEDSVTQTGESMDENLSSVEKAKKKLKEAEDVHAKNPLVDVNADARAYVEAIGAPSEADRARIEGDGRYGEEGFDKMMRTVMADIFKDMSEETVAKMLNSAIGGVYRFDFLSEQYAYGEIDRAFWVKAVYESSLMEDRELASILTDEQYVAYSGGIPKDQEIPNPLAVLGQEDMQVFLAFPEIARNNPEIKSVDDLYALVDPTIVSDLMQFTEEHGRAEMRLGIQAENGEISMDDSFEISDQNQASYDNYVRSVLTPEQQVLFLGEPREESDAPTKDDDTVSIDDDEEFDDTPIIEGSEDWNALIAEGAEPEAIRKFHETGVLYIAPKEQK